MSFKKVQEEEAYIARQEFEKKQKIEEEKQGRLAKEEKEQLKKIHYMHCPKCGMQLIEIDYRGIKIDECSGCNGVWLDAGELEAIADMEKPALNKLFSIFSK